MGTPSGVISRKTFSPASKRAVPRCDSATGESRETDRERERANDRETVRDSHRERVKERQRVKDREREKCLPVFHLFTHPPV
jgi:hypothetical protein